MKKVALGVLPLFSMLPLAEAIAAEVATNLEEVEVVAVTPLQFGGVDINKIPANVQTVSAEKLQEAQALSLADYMNRYLGSVNINDAQNNPLQPDVQYRGFSASPLMGLPQGLATYVNGIRFNEPFGDMINWDLIPNGAIDNMSLQPASNPAFGLNALGGSININTKTGFSAPGHSFEAQGGSWDRHSEELTSGWNNGTWGYFLDAKYFNEKGWRAHSPSEAKQGFGTLSWRGVKSGLDFSIAGSDNTLRGNGALPQEMLAFGRDQVFTHPDITRNRMMLVSLAGDTWLNDHNQLSGTMYYRRNKIGTYNGDGSEFGACLDEGGGENAFLCQETDGELADEGLFDLAGNNIDASPVVEGGTINTSSTLQQSFGFALQNAFDQKIFGRNNHLVGGASFDHGNARYHADTQLGSLTADRGVSGGGVLLQDAHVRLTTETDHYGVFLTDTYSLTDKLDLTVSGRYNQSHIKLRDHVGDDLNGSHSFDRFNPAAGLTYAFMPELTFFGNYSESSRVPTPMELSCANPDDPCRLPNAFVSDPPLKQVVANTFETGVRGRLKNLLPGYMDWNLALFRTINNNDIIFKSTGGVGSNVGYFDNVGSTLRQGVEAGLSGNFYERWRWSTHYTYIDASFETPFLGSSPNNPLADGDGNIHVKAGDKLPGIPAHQFKFSTDFDIVSAWTLGMDMNYNSSQYLRGDEANLTAKLPGFVVFNLRSEYRFNKNVALFGKVSNLFDRQYANFGTWGNTGDVLDGVGLPGDQQSRFVGVGAPRAAWIGIRLTM
ncbi:TonB-dependent receptor [Methylomonas fluvii]|uniref:TonB-dependent receptor n=1 Tax=Methylomonas fluvii TaxID=1854564 RepID=A0ABR9DLC4_9GAMM|nr:TonB-dependent receptor [Methylomonas fluvii]MBD9363641.1 TonB-dependent receptor [Methylomonas fluvii]CAD6876942.1 TonB-dependent receptor [Methylomonas fluvii]